MQPRCWMLNDISPTGEGFVLFASRFFYSLLQEKDDIFIVFCHV